MLTLGVLLMILWMLSRMALLSWADLSYVLPVTAIGYVLVALVGKALLDEQISGEFLSDLRGFLRNRQTHPVVEAGAHPLGLLMSLMTVQAEMRKMKRQAQS